MSTPSEDQQITRVIANLVQRFPGLTVQVITATVHTTYRAFDGAPVRDYIPVLVERRARIVLAASALPLAA